ncbi:DUF6036 family nucleotidyltransferase [Arthrobacter sp. N1]|uniref:DUF6036 family nucleotidyltransferase n=1 Tax=Arthrobacter sp. N1 TaxID=619291 RepID=UPI003BB020AD
MLLLEELEARLNDRGVQMDIQIVGGAALLLHNLLDRATEDIDARYQSAEVVDAVVDEMALDYGLPKQWLNSRAAAFLPNDAQWMAPPGMSSAIRLADLESMAAMKLAAQREKDVEDLVPLALALNIDEPERLLEIAYEKYGEESIPLNGDRADYLIVAEEVVRAARARREGQQ